MRSTFEWEIDLCFQWEHEPNFGVVCLCLCLHDEVYPKLKASFGVNMRRTTWRVRAEGVEPVQGYSRGRSKQEG